MSAGNSRGPVLARRRLRTELRRLRESAKLSLEAVAGEMFWSVSKIVRIESGAVGISVNDTKALLELYDATTPEVGDELLALAKDSRQRMWWGKYRDQLPSPFLELIGLENDAARVLHYHPFIVPGLLQTSEYAGAVNDNSLTDPGTATQVEVRMLRQKQLFSRTPPPEYVAVFDQSVLYRRFGEGPVLRDQLNALLDLIREPNIAIVIVPTDTRSHQGAPVGFAILEFADPRDTPIVFHDQPGSDIAADTPEDVARYHELFEKLLAQGLHGTDAVAAIKEAREKA
jgi:transcriptional regulator with XRE-family HTH domain